MSADEQGYNGWKNYETWAVGMYLDGNYTGADTYEDILTITREELAHENDPSAHNVAARIEGYVTYEVFGADSPSSIATDLLRAALSEVDWRELATHKIAEVSE